MLNFDKEHFLFSLYDKFHNKNNKIPGFVIWIKVSHYFTIMSFLKQKHQKYVNCISALTANIL